MGYKYGGRLIDTHAHLDDGKFDADREAVIQRAAQAGVKAIVTIGTDLPSSRAAVALSERYPGVYAAVGVHPHDAKWVDQAALDELRDLASHSRVVAVGEIGLDFYRDLSPREVQRTAFEAQLALASEANKPVVLHIRDKKDQNGAYDQTLAILRAWLSSQPTIIRPGVLHCFSGSLRAACEALDLGFYVGVDGPITYPNAGNLRAIVAQLPLERLLLETDCPYLAPQPRRGRRNEPAYVTYIAAKVAEITKSDVVELAKRTMVNAVRLFRLPTEEES